MHQQDLHRRNAHGSNPQPPPVGSGGRPVDRPVAQDAAKAILFGHNAWVQRESGGSEPLGKSVPQNARNPAKHADQQSAASQHQRVDLGTQSQTSRKFQHIERLTAGIGISGQALNPQNEIAMQVQMQQTKTHFLQSQTTNERNQRRLIVFKGRKRIEK
jgi:hypothetical protein